MANQFGRSCDYEGSLGDEAASFTGCGCISMDGTNRDSFAFLHFPIYKSYMGFVQAACE